MKNPFRTNNTRSKATMISDSTLYSLSIFLGSLAMLLIVLYHYLEVNSHDNNNGSSENTSPDHVDEKVGIRTPHARNTSTAGFDKANTTVPTTGSGSMGKGGGGGS